VWADRRVVVGLVLAGVLSVGSVTWALLDDAPYDARPPATGAPRPLPALAAAALTDLSAALTDGDADAAATLAAPGDARAAELLGAVARGAAHLGLSVDLRYVDETGGVSPDGGWSAAVEARWRFAGDTGSVPAQSEVTVRFVPSTDDRVGIAGFGDPSAGRVPTWLAGGVEVAQRPGVLVVAAGEGTAARQDAERYLRLAVTGVRVVRRVLPSWHGRVVLEVPASSAALDRAMDVEPGTTGGIAAVTVPVDGSAGTDSPVHVFVNPEVFDRLRPTGAQVVVSHEVVHLATGAARSDAEPWLVEGFADYVALRDVDVPVTTSAGQVIEQVRRDGVPQALPGPDDFAARTGHLGATYESAWLVCVVLAETRGERALVALYDDVVGGRPLAAALQRRVGLSVEELTRRWQQRLSRLAG
jgi:hypothetical protein